MKRSNLNCTSANRIDLVDYLAHLGYQPQKINANQYWYFSPLREEKTASFKVDKSKNIWYDHGLGKGGRLVDFAIELYHSSVSEAQYKISFFHQQEGVQNIIARPPFHSQENLFNQGAERETAIKIIAAKQPIQDLVLCRHLKLRRVEKSIADRYCYEVVFTNSDKLFTAIGFKNNAGGYELRNEYFKGSNSPKYITYLDNSADKISVFEDFFDFLSRQTIVQNQEQQLTNFLVLNSLSYFERSLLLMEKHTSIHLYLDQDSAGRKCTSVALKRSPAFKDESKFYNGYKDLNDWIMNIGRI